MVELPYVGMYLAEKVYKKALLGMHTSAKKETTSEGDGCGAMTLTNIYLAFKSWSDREGRAGRFQPRHFFGGDLTLFSRYHRL